MESKPPQRAQLRVDADHPALPGHFPGQPVVPGVVILDRVLMEIRRLLPQVSVIGVRRMKFLRRLDPDSSFELECGPVRAGVLPFKCSCDGEALAEGKLLLAEDS